jgi:hypothetical protein
MTRASNSTSLGQIACFTSGMKGLGVTVLSMPQLGVPLSSEAAVRLEESDQWSFCQQCDHIFRALLGEMGQRDACCLRQICWSHRMGIHDDICTYHH